MATIRSLPARVRGSLARARSRQRRKPAPRLPRFGSFLVIVLAGAMMAVSARMAGGSDLRPSRDSDLADLVRAKADQNARLQAEAGDLRSQVQQLSNDAGHTSTDQSALDRAAAQAAMTPVKGPAVRVTLTDAPLSVQPIGVDGDLLVVHQQDIQTVANVLWAGGAEAMTIQGQRVTSLTGIKCVGNTVILRGVPYAPPYVVTAIGDPARLRAALAASHEVAIYQQYVQAYHLGWKQEQLASVTMPGYSGAVDLQEAKALR